MPYVTIQGRELEYVRLASQHPRSNQPGRPEVPPIVFLHEGLGSISLWRDFPQKVADATGCEAIVFSRYGYGQSTPRDDAPRDVRYMHDEALLALPEFLQQLGLEQFFLFGHSDGSSIALLYGANGVPPPLGMIVMAPHVLVEDITIAGIAEATEAYRTTPLRQRLGRHHRDVDSVFDSWSNIWLSPEFRAWNIEECLPRITCPILAIQGEDDEYGTMAQVDLIAAQVSPYTRISLLKLPQCGHSPQRDQPEAVIAASVEFIEGLLERSTGADPGCLLRPKL